MSNLVYIKQNRVLTDSLRLAEMFEGGRHTDILRKIRARLAKTPEDFSQRNFASSEYVDSRGKTQPMYEMTQLGFTHIAVSYNTPEGIELSVKVLNEFARASEELQKRGISVQSLDSMIDEIANTPKQDALKEMHLRLTKTQPGDTFSIREKTIEIGGNTLTVQIPTYNGVEGWLTKQVCDYFGVTNVHTGGAAAKYKIQGIKLTGSQLNPFARHGMIKCNTTAMKFWSVSELEVMANYRNKPKLVEIYSKVFLNNVPVKEPRRDVISLVRPELQSPYKQIKDATSQAEAETQALRSQLVELEDRLKAQPQGVSHEQEAEIKALKNEVKVLKRFQEWANECPDEFLRKNMVPSAQLARNSAPKIWREIFEDARAWDNHKYHGFFLRNYGRAGLLTMYIDECMGQPTTIATRVGNNRGKNAMEEFLTRAVYAPRDIKLMEMRTRAGEGFRSQIEKGRIK